MIILLYFDVFLVLKRPTNSKPLNKINLQGVKKVPDPKQNYIGLMTEG